MKYKIMKMRTTFNNGEVQVLYNLGYIDRFLFWTWFNPSKSFSTLKEAEAILKIMDERKGTKSKEYLEIV